MPSQHKHPPISVRLPEGDRAWLMEYAEATGRAVNSVLTEAVAEYRAHRRDLSGYEIHHKDGDPSNLDITNLEIRKSRKS